MPTADCLLDDAAANENGAVEVDSHPMNWTASSASLLAYLMVSIKTKRAERRVFACDLADRAGIKKHFKTIAYAT